MKKIVIKSKIRKTMVRNIRRIKKTNKNAIEPDENEHLL